MAFGPLPVGIKKIKFGKKKEICQKNFPKKWGFFKKMSKMSKMSKILTKNSQKKKISQKNENLVKNIV